MADNHVCYFLATVLHLLIVTDSGMETSKKLRHPAQLARKSRAQRLNPAISNMPSMRE